MKYEEMLRRTFGDVAFGEYDGTTTCVVPGLFRYTGFYGESRIRCLFNRDLPRRVSNEEYGTRRCFIDPVPLQGIGDTHEESAEMVYDALIHEPDIFMHAPKLNDQFEPVVGKKYVTIHNNDRLHVHGDTSMIDFRGVFFHRWIGGVIIDENYGDYHSHLMPEEVFYDRLRNER